MKQAIMIKSLNLTTAIIFAVSPAVEAELLGNINQANYLRAPASTNSSTLQELKDIFGSHVIANNEWLPVAELNGKILINDFTNRIRYADQSPAVESKVTLWAVRHGETFANKDDVLQGQVDEDQNQLNEQGMRQAKEAAERLFDKLKDKIDSGEEIVILTSPYGRAKDTAEYFLKLVSGKTNIRFMIDDGLKEISFGVFDNRQPGEEFETQYRKNLNASIRPENGESFTDLLVRVKKYLEQLNKKYAGKTVVLFGHGTHISAVRALLKDTSLLDESGQIDWRANMVANASPTLLSDGGYHDKAVQIADYEYCIEQLSKINTVLKIKTPAKSAEIVMSLIRSAQEQNGKKGVIVAIDGNSGAFKTTIAEEAARAITNSGGKAVVINRDWFIRSRDERYQRQNYELSNNGISVNDNEISLRVDKFKTEVLERLRQFKESSADKIVLQLNDLYDREDPNGGLTLSKTITVDQDTAVIIEGNFILIPAWMKYFDVTALILAHPETGINRRLSRDVRTDQKRVENIFWRLNTPSFNYFMKNKMASPDVVMLSDEQPSAGQGKVVVNFSNALRESLINTQFLTAA